MFKSYLIITGIPIMDGIILPMIISSDRLPLILITTLVVSIAGISIALLNREINIICSNNKIKKKKDKKK